jgi:hypothetical protein
MSVTHLSAAHRPHRSGRLPWAPTSAIDAALGLGGVAYVALPTRTLSSIGPVSITSQTLGVS